jgi:hypothetical protein
MEASLKAVKKAAKSSSRIVWGEGIGDRVPRLGLQRYKEHNRSQYPGLTRGSHFRQPYCGHSQLRLLSEP